MSEFQAERFNASRPFMVKCDLCDDQFKSYPLSDVRAVPDGWCAWEDDLGWRRICGAHPTERAAVDIAKGPPRPAYVMIPPPPTFWQRIFG
jgi:hypothetical protein